MRLKENPPARRPEGFPELNTTASHRQEAEGYLHCSQCRAVLAHHTSRIAGVCLYCRISAEAVVA